MSVCKSVCVRVNACTSVCLLAAGACNRLCSASSKYESDRLNERVGSDALVLPTMLEGGASFIFSIKSASCLE